MASNLERAAEIIDKHEGNAQLIFSKLDRAGLLMSDDVTEEWQAMVGWRNHAGQVEETHGTGLTRDSALEDARSQPRWLSNAVEIAHKCAVRHVTAWEAEESITYTEKANDE